MKKYGQTSRQARAVLPWVAAQVLFQLSVNLYKSFVEGTRQVEQLIADSDEPARFMKLYGRQLKRRLLGLERELEVLQEAGGMMVNDMVQLQLEPAQLIAVEIAAQRRANELVQGAVEDIKRMGVAL